MHYFLFGALVIPVGALVVNFPSIAWLMVALLVLWGLDKTNKWQVKNNP